jgi:hypothetical protein
MQKKNEWFAAREKRHYGFAMSCPVARPYQLVFGEAPFELDDTKLWILIDHSRPSERSSHTRQSSALPAACSCATLPLPGVGATADATGNSLHLASVVDIVVDLLFKLFTTVGFGGWLFHV